MSDFVALTEATDAATKAVMDETGKLPTARIAEVFAQTGETVTEAEAVAYLDTHEPSEDGPLATQLAAATEARNAYNAAHDARREYMLSLHEGE